MPDAKAIYTPKNLTSLRPGLAAFAGREFAFEYVGTSGEDESYPGQTRWVFSREHDFELGAKLAGLWVPEEDLEPRPSAPF